MDYFGYGIQDFIPCEICEDRAVDIHHILARKKRPDLINDINNLMAVCRVCHQDYGDRTEHLEYLQKIHNLKLRTTN